MPYLNPFAPRRRRSPFGGPIAALDNGLAGPPAPQNLLPPPPMNLLPPPSAPPQNLLPPFPHNLLPPGQGPLPAGPISGLPPAGGVGDAGMGGQFGTPDPEAIYRYWTQQRMNDVNYLGGRPGGQGFNLLPPPGGYAGGR